jgi:acyl-ACP thioesterase
MSDITTFIDDRSIFGAKYREGKFFELEMTVRDCDLDVYGVVNNAVYAGYIETGLLRTLYHHPNNSRIIYMYRSIYIAYIYNYHVVLYYISRYSFPNP